MTGNPCIDKLLNAYPELHKYLEGKVGATGSKDQWINAAKELQNETLNNLHNAYNKIGLKGYEKTKPEVITPSVREVVSDGGEKKDDTHLIISASVKTRLAYGVKKQIIEIENGQPIVKEIEFSKEDAELELDRLEALVEKGRLTPDEFQRSYFGQSAVTEVITDARELISKDPVKFIKDLRNTFEEKITTEQQTTPSVESKVEKPKLRITAVPSLEEVLNKNIDKLTSITDKLKSGMEAKRVIDQLENDFAGFKDFAKEKLGTATVAKLWKLHETNPDAVYKLLDDYSKKLTAEAKSENKQPRPTVEGSGEQKKVENNLGKLISIKTGKETKSLDEIMDQLKKESDRRASLSPEQKRREVDVKDAAASVKELLTKKALLEVRKQFEGLDEATVNKYQDIYDNDINKIYDAFPELGEAPVGKKSVLSYIKPVSQPTDIKQTQGSGEKKGVSVILPGENKKPEVILLKKEGETVTAEPPPPEQPTHGTGIFFERPTTELSFRGLQNVANEFGYEDVKSRDRVSDIKEQTNARETSEDWASKGTYQKNIDELLSKIEDRELVPTAKQRLVLQQYLANESAKLRSIKDKNSNEFDEQLNVVKRIKDIGQIARQESGAALRIPEGGGSISHPIEDYADAMIAKMDANGVTELTEKQKSDVEERIKKYEEATREAENKVAVMEAKLSEIEAKKELSKSAKKVKQPTTKKTHDEFVAERKGYIEELKAAKKEQEDWIKDQGIQKMGISGFTLTPKMVKIVGKMVGSHVEEIGGKLSDVTKRIYDEIKEVFDGITQKDVHDIIAGVYNPERKTLSQLQIDLRNVREEAKLINKYDSLLKGQPLTEVGKRKRNQELKDIREKISGFKKEELAANKFYKEEISSDAKKMIAIRRRNESQERKIRSDISSKNYSEKSKSSVIANKELKQQFPKLYNEMIDAIHNREEAKHEYDIDLFRDQLSKRSFGAKATDFLSKVSGTIKAIVTGIDDSAVAIQTFVSLLTRPVIGAKALKIHAESAFSQKVFDRFLTELHNSSDWPLIKESGLNVTEPKSLKATEKEEIFDNRFSGTIKIKGKEYKLIDAPLKPFERAFTALGNAVRVLAFREKAQSYIRQGYSFENNPELFKSLATRLNTESGRGKENQYIQQASKVVTLGIWSPKLMASKFNLLGISDLASLVLSKAGTEGYYRKLHPKERIEAIKDVAKFVGGVMAMSYAVALAFGAEVDTDPLSSTFMNVKFKNGKSINFTGGFSSYIRQVAQFIKGGVTTSGKFKKVNRLDVATRFFRGKTPPMTSAGINSLVGKNFMGQPTTPLEEGKKLLMPISVQGISKEIKNDGAESLFTEGIPTFFGFNITDAKDFDKSKKR